MKIVLKVAITCKKCKTCVLRIASKVPGIKSLTFDEEKATLTVVGDVDVVKLVEALRKDKHPAEVVSVVDEKKEAEDKKKKEEEEKKKKEEEEKKEAEEKKKKEEEKRRMCAQMYAPCPKPYPPPCPQQYCIMEDQPGTCTIV
ncbi:hypothetical protein EJB05_17422 [Eragrostis curvula]|uniref:HMA domain-containing protein n=1 Tax=Eragrostis curvula TaxID=38414 RepID=A0A5J9VJ26_9POAL|nr:hypothetical protein EJB05_17422 [Eragrostis curvula]